MKPASLPLYLTTEAAIDGLELLLGGHKRIAEAASEALARRGLGRAHHRALRTVARYPGIPVSELLDRLGITKQSLSRVLLALRRSGLVTTSSGRQDRRQKLLYATGQGLAVLNDVEEGQRTIIVDAYEATGAEAVAGFRMVLAQIAAPGLNPASEMPQGNGAPYAPLNQAAIGYKAGGSLDDERE